MEFLNYHSKELKLTVINMIRVLMGKVDNVEKQMLNIRTEMETLRKN